MATINRPTTKTVISTTQWGIPITDQVNANTADIATLKTTATPTAWTLPTLLNGFTTWGAPYQQIGYRKIGDVVYFRGLINATGGSVNAVMFNLPVGYRPTANEDFSFVPNGQTSPNIISCAADGTVKCGAKAGTAFWFSGFSFSTIN